MGTKIYHYSIIIYIVLFTFLVSSCKKGWLEEKPNKALVVPHTLDDLQAILDNSRIFVQNNPALGEIGAGDYYLNLTTWEALTTPTEKNGFVWASDVYEGQSNDDWNNSYQQIFYTNVVLEGIADISSDLSNELQVNNITGGALYLRAYSFYNLAQLFCKSYDVNTAETDLGICLKLSADINEKVVRGSVDKTYGKIIFDLNEAAKLLPVSSPTGSKLEKVRPSKTAAYALLARTYLAMSNYDSAWRYADLCLQLNNSLIDFNTLSLSQANPVPQFNNETIIYTEGVNYGSFATSRLIVDSILYKSYELNDLRRTLFYFTNAGNITYKGSYTKSRLLFTGIATDEMYLTRAECYARKGNVLFAMKDLNDLLRTRWKTDVNGVTTYVDQTATDANDALAKILVERRKELVFRGIRWTDLRRFNKEGANIVLTRVLSGKTYILPPNDPKYVLPIPDNELQLSDIQQNPR